MTRLWLVGSGEGKISCKMEREMGSAYRWMKAEGEKGLNLHITLGKISPGGKVRSSRVLHLIFIFSTDKFKLV